MARRGLATEVSLGSRRVGQVLNPREFAVKVGLGSRHRVHSRDAITTTSTITTNRHHHHHSGPQGRRSPSSSIRTWQSLPLPPRSLRLPCSPLSQEWPAALIGRAPLPPPWRGGAVLGAGEWRERSAAPALRLASLGRKGRPCKIAVFDSRGGVNSRGFCAGRPFLPSSRSRQTHRCSRHQHPPPYRACFRRPAVSVRRGEYVPSLGGRRHAPTRSRDGDCSCCFERAAAASEQAAEMPMADFRARVAHLAALLGPDGRALQKWRVTWSHAGWQPTVDHSAKQRTDGVDAFLEQR